MVEEEKTEDTREEPALTPTPTPPGKKKKQVKATQEEPEGTKRSQPPKKKRTEKEPAKIPEPKRKVQKTGDGEGPRTRKRTGGEPATFARRIQPTSASGKVKWVALKEVFLGEIKPKLVAHSVGYSSHEDLSFHGLSQFILCFFVKNGISHIKCKFNRCMF